MTCPTGLHFNQVLMACVKTNYVNDLIGYMTFFIATPILVLAFLLKFLVYVQNKLMSIIQPGARQFT